MNNIWLYEDRSQHFSTVYYFSDDRVTIRTFANLFPLYEGEEYTEEEFVQFVTKHEQPFAIPNIPDDRKPIDGSFFSTDKAGIKLFLVDALTFSQDSGNLGHSLATDQCVIIMKNEYLGYMHMPFNRTAETMLGRLYKDAIYRDRRTGGILSLKTDFANTPWTEASIVVKNNPDYGCKVYVEGVGEVTPQPVPEDLDTPHTYATLVLSASETVEAEAYTNVSVRCQMPDGTLRTDCQSEVFLEAVSGYLPKTRVQLVDGIGAFKVGAIGLTAGDKVRVKAGWRYVPGLGDVSITVE